MTDLAEALRRTAGRLAPHREAILEAWVEALQAEPPAPAEELRRDCERGLDAMLLRFGAGEVEPYLQEELIAAAEALKAGATLAPLARAIRCLHASCLPFHTAACPDRESLAESLLALQEVGARRLEGLLRAQEEAAGRRLLESQEQAARAAERARELAALNETLRRSEARSQHRADQLGLLASVAHRLAGVLDPERLLQEAAETIRARMNYTYVAVVVLDDEGVLVGRWAGRPGVGRRSAGRTQGPAGGVIGRALRKRAPQVVGDVAADPDYHADVPGARSEMVVPLLDEGHVVGAIDYQSDQPQDFDLDDVAAGEVLAEFLVVALRNARLFAEARRAVS